MTSADGGAPSSRSSSCRARADSRSSRMKPPADRALGARGANGSAMPMMPSHTATIHHRRRTAKRPRRSKLMPSAVRDSGAGGWLSLVGLPSPDAARRGQTGTRLRHHGMPDASPAAARTRPDGLRGARRHRATPPGWCGIRETGEACGRTRWYKSRRERGFACIGRTRHCRARRPVPSRPGCRSPLRTSPGPGCRPRRWSGPTASWRRSGRTTCSSTSPCSSSASTGGSRWQVSVGGRARTWAR